MNRITIELNALEMQKMNSCFANFQRNLHDLAIPFVKHLRIFATTYMLHIHRIREYMREVKVTSYLYVSIQGWQIYVCAVTRQQTHLSICSDKCKKYKVPFTKQVIFDRNGAKAYVKNRRALSQRNIRETWFYEILKSSIVTPAQQVVAYPEVSKLRVKGQRYEIFKVYFFSLGEQIKIFD